MLSTLIVIACLADAPPETPCKDHQIILEYNNPYYCAILGQQIAAQWQEDHPKWQVQGWRCELGTRQWKS